ncbi:hypothetical protein ABZS36_22640 [Micromonospora arida]
MLYKEIGVRIGRDPSVVPREVARHGGRAGYRAVTADSTATAARRRPKLFAVDRSPRLRSVVVERLRAGWSPASIAGCLPELEPATSTNDRPRSKAGRCRGTGKATW